MITTERTRRIWGLLLCLVMTGVQALAYNATLGTTSKVQLVSSRGGIGMMLEPLTAPDNDEVNLKPGDAFVLTAENLDSYYVVSGQLAVGLVRNGNQLVGLLYERKFSSVGSINFVYAACKVPSDVVPQEGDEIRLLTSENGGVDYNPIEAAMGSQVVTSIPAVGYKLPLQHINVPAHITGGRVVPSSAQIWPDKTVRGRNYYFSVETDEPDAIVAVSINGETMVPANGIYSLSRVLQDYDIDVRIYSKGEVEETKVIQCDDLFRVRNRLTQAELDCVKNLKVKGYVYAEDFTYFRSRMPSLQVLDLSETMMIDNVLPYGAFDGNSSIQYVRLPNSLTAFLDNGFRYMRNLQFIEIPYHVCYFGFNEFFGCEKLKKVWVRWDPIAEGCDPVLGYPVPPCAFRATPYTTEGTLVVPKGCVDAYRYTVVWGEFKTIREEAPVDPILAATPFRVFDDNPSGVNDSRSLTVKVWPGDGGCWVSTDSGRETRAVVVDMAGRVRAEERLSSPLTHIDLEPGCYVVKVEDRHIKILVR